MLKSCAVPMTLYMCGLGAFSCTGAPYSGSTYDHRSSEIEITGASQSAGLPLIVQVCTNPWWFCAGSETQEVDLDTLTSAPPWEPSYTDNHNNVWFGYHGFVNVPKQYWSVTDDPNLPYRAHVRLVWHFGQNLIGTQTYDNSPTDCPEALGTDQLLSGNPLCAKSFDDPIPGEETLPRKRHGWIPIYAKAP